MREAAWNKDDEPRKVALGKQPERVAKSFAD